MFAFVSPVDCVCFVCCVCHLYCVCLLCLCFVLHDFDMYVCLLGVIVSVWSVLIVVVVLCMCVVIVLLCVL